MSNFTGRLLATSRSPGDARGPGAVVELGTPSTASARLQRLHRGLALGVIHLVEDALAAESSASPIGVVRIADRHLVVQFDGIASVPKGCIGPPLPWSAGGDGASWTTETSRLKSWTARGRGISWSYGDRPSLVALSDQMWVDLSVVRRLALVGQPDELAPILASLATSTGEGGVGPVIVVGVDDLPLSQPSIADDAVVVVIGQTAPHDWSGWTIRVSGGPAEVEAPNLRQDELQLQLLGTVEASTGLAGLTDQQLSVVAFLACTGSAHRSTIVDAVWGGRAVSERRLANVLAEIRSTVGRHHVPQSEHGRYRLDAVTSDLAELSGRLAVARSKPSSAATHAVERALAAVRGVPLSPPGSRYWSWIDERVDLVAAAELVVTSAAELVAREMLSGGQYDRALRACNAGLLASPMHEGLVSLLMEVHNAAGRLGSARRLAERFQAASERLHRDWSPMAPQLGSRAAPSARSA